MLSWDVEETFVVAFTLPYIKKRKGRLVGVVFLIANGMFVDFVKGHFICRIVELLKVESCNCCGPTNRLVTCSCV